MSYWINELMTNLLGGQPQPHRWLWNILYIIHFFWSSGQETKRIWHVIPFFIILLLVAANCLTLYSTDLVWVRLFYKQFCQLGDLWMNKHPCKSTLTQYFHIFQVCIFLFLCYLKNGKLHLTPKDWLMTNKSYVSKMPTGTMTTSTPALLLLCLY